MKRPGEIALAVVLLLFFVVACGRKADPKPANLVRPERIQSLRTEVTREGVRLEWQRPDEYVNGDRMDDLGGFLVFRGVPDAVSEEIADIPVEDRHRFRQEKKYDHLDATTEPGHTYFYRIVSYTTDRYYSLPSNQATVLFDPSSEGAAANGEDDPE